MGKKKARKITIDNKEWAYVVEHDPGRKDEVRIYQNKQIVKRVRFNELGFDDFRIEHGGCNVTPIMIKEYIKHELDNE